MLARIYRPSKTAMQSGKYGTRYWRLEFAPDKPRTIDPLMGWTSSADTRTQVNSNSTPRKTPSPIARSTAFPTRSKTRAAGG